MPFGRRYALNRVPCSADGTPLNHQSSETVNAARLYLRVFCRHVPRFAKTIERPARGPCMGRLSGEQFRCRRLGHGYDT
jgi:hypothetical protein